MAVLERILLSFAENTLYIRLISAELIFLATAVSLYVVINILIYAIFKSILPNIQNPYYVLLYPMPIFGAMLYVYTALNMWKTRRALVALEEIHQNAKKVVKESLETFYKDL